MDDKATGLAQSVVEECSDVLTEPEKSKAQAATKTLVACIRASRGCSSQGIPPMWPDHPLQRPWGLLPFLKSCLRCSANITRNPKSRIVAQYSL